MLPSRSPSGRTVVAGRFGRVTRVAVASLLLAGCSGGDGLERIPVRGTVLLPDGTPLTGAISLLPEPGQHGPAVTTSIDEGCFEFSDENGPVAGPHRAIVQLDPPAKADLLSGQAAGRGPRPAPRRTRWEMHVEIPNRGPFPYNVKLE